MDVCQRPERPAWTRMSWEDGGAFPVNKGHPFYERDLYTANEAPMKTVERYLAPRII